MTAPMWLMLYSVLALFFVHITLDGPWRARKLVYAFIAYHFVVIALGAWNAALSS